MVQRLLVRVYIPAIPAVLITEYIEGAFIFRVAVAALCVGFSTWLFARR